jgi:FkbM family methyltransferase
MTDNSFPQNIPHIVDAGARYGVHPTWRDYDGPYRYFMFEPDPLEAERLSEKYKERADEITVIGKALGRSEGQMTLNVLGHRGQSTMFTPNNDSAWFSRYRAGEDNIVDRLSVPTISLDQAGREHGIEFDFVKSDTEGSEPDIFLGAVNQLDEHILGVRCEVFFGDIYEQGTNFATIEEILKKSGFRLLNIDCAGEGSPINPYYKGDVFGYLEGTDAVWIKPVASIIENSGWSDDKKIISSLKLSAFCFNNNATDVAVQNLLDLNEAIPNAVANAQDIYLFKYLDRKVQTLFKDLGNHLAHRHADLDSTYLSIFGRKRKLRHEFFQDPELNP